MYLEEDLKEVDRVEEVEEGEEEEGGMGEEMVQGGIMIISHRTEARGEGGTLQMMSLRKTELASVNGKRKDESNLK